MSDQTLEDNSLEWGVDWASAKTWGRFVGLSLLIAFVLSAGNVGMVGIARLIASITHGDWDRLSFSLWDPEMELPLLHQIAVFLVLWLFLVTPVVRWAEKSPSRTVPKDFPISLLEEDRQSHFGWLILILGLYGIMYLGMAMFPLGVFGIAEDNWDLLWYSFIFLIFGKDGVKALFWRVLAEARPHDLWKASQRSWSARSPGMMIALLATISVLALALVMVSVLAWEGR